MPRNATQNEERKPITPDQIRVLERLLAGETVTAAAKAVGVDRSTLHRWLRDDFEFQAALNRWKRELSNAVQARLLAITHKAAQTVENAVDQGNLTASLAVLKGMGALSGTPVSSGCEDPKILSEEAELAREEAELVKAERENSRMLRTLAAGADLFRDRSQ